MLTKERMGEIALTLFKEKFRTKERTFDRGFKKELGNIAKNTGITLGELVEFRKTIIKELFKETFDEEV